MTISGLTNPVWELQLETRLHLQCWLREIEGSIWSLTLTYGDDTVLHECYPTDATARLRADVMKGGMMARGWRAVGSASSAAQ